ncbi:hypothetical protein ACFCW2_00245 [Qipengyuania sp. DSG2-2]|uniref:hypothetical protein n=1 Tax=Qipengyuania sp. DGS2-2 TaxID=3349631 RepID=UPI0036D26263
MKRTRRSLVLTDEAARHPFRASIPPHVLGEDPPVRLRSKFMPGKDDIRGFVSAYFASLVAALVFIA